MIESIIPIFTTIVLILITIFNFIVMAIVAILTLPYVIYLQFFKGTNDEKH